MRAAKAKYELLGQDLVRLKNVLSNEPVGPKAEKRKKEITDLEIKVMIIEGTYTIIEIYKILHSRLITTIYSTTVHSYPCTCQVHIHARWLDFKGCVRS